jgi:hypothetical protein
MTAEVPSAAMSECEAVPAAVKELCLLQNQRCEHIRSSVDSIRLEIVGPNTRESRFELAAAIADVADELRSLVQRKLDAGFFDGSDGTASYLQERGAHLVSDYRRLLDALRTARHETAAGKPRKAHRQLTSWLRHFSDQVSRESDLTRQLWNVDIAAL